MYKVCFPPPQFLAPQQPCEVGSTERRWLLRGHPVNFRTEWGLELGVPRLETGALGSLRSQQSLLSRSLLEFHGAQESSISGLSPPLAESHQTPSVQSSWGPPSQTSLPAALPPTLPLALSTPWIFSLSKRTQQTCLFSPSAPVLVTPQFPPSEPRSAGSCPASLGNVLPPHRWESGRALAPLPRPWPASLPEPWPHPGSQPVNGCLPSAEGNSVIVLQGL